MWWFVVLSLCLLRTLKIEVWTTALGHLQSLANVSLRVARFCIFCADENNCHRLLEAHSGSSQL